MMKKFISIFILIPCLATLVYFTGCSPRGKEGPSSDGADSSIGESEKVRITFIVDDFGGGTLKGETVQTVAVGKKTSPVRAIPSLGYAFTGWSTGETAEEITVTAERDAVVKATFQIQPYGLPVIMIDTENGAPVLDKETYVPCNISVGNTEETYAVDDAAAKIKLRGNTTIGYDKKPYKFKFTEKRDLFGFGKSKTWVLLADYIDGSMMRNLLAFSLGTLLGLAETSHAQPVEVYFNGSYDGVYLLCEQTETGSTRVDISEEIAEGDAQPFLLELDNRAPSEGQEGLDWFSHWDDCGQKYFAVKSPETDEAGYSERVTANISRIVDEVWSVLCTGTWEEIERRIDTDSFAKTCLVHQMFKTYDAVAYSWFIYKDAGAESKIKSGPIWDFDLSAGLGDVPLSGETPLVDPEALWPASEARANRWYVQLLKHEEFKEKIVSLLNTHKDEIVSDIDGKVQLAKSHADSYHRNYARWDNLQMNSIYIPEEIKRITTWEGHADYLAAYLKKSLNYLVNYYCGEDKE